MKINLEIQYRLRVSKLGQNDFIQTGVAVQVEGSFPVLEVHGEEQAHQPEVMITMQVTDENVPDPMDVNSIVGELYLGTFAAINQKVVAPDRKVLASGESTIGRQCATGSQDGK